MDCVRKQNFIGSSIANLVKISEGRIKTVALVFLLTKLIFVLFMYIVGTTKEHLGLVMALKVPTFVILNKNDVCLPTTMERTCRVLDRLLKSPGCNKVPMVVQTEDDVITAATNFNSNQ